MIYAAAFAYYIVTTAITFACFAVSFGKITIGDIPRAVLLGWVGWWYCIILTIDLKMDATFWEKVIWERSHDS